MFTDRYWKNMFPLLLCWIIFVKYKHSQNLTPRIFPKKIAFGYIILICESWAGFLILYRKDSITGFLYHPSIKKIYWISCACISHTTRHFPLHNCHVPFKITQKKKVDGKMLTMIMMIVWLDGVHLMCVHYLNFKYLCRFSFFPTPLIYPPPHLVEPFHPFTAIPKALNKACIVGWLAGYALTFHLYILCTHRRRIHTFIFLSPNFSFKHIHLYT